MSKKCYKIEGMDCTSCAAMIELDLEDAGITAKCNFAKQTLEVDGNASDEKVIEVVSSSGYTIKS